MQTYWAGALGAFPQDAPISPVQSCVRDQSIRALSLN